MGKTFLLSLILLLSIVTVNAQRYSMNKLKYDYHLYVP